MTAVVSPETELFNQIKDSLISFDPVSFCEKYLTLDGKSFRLRGSGFKPFADIYRYIGIKALEKDAMPVVMVKGRQVGATTMAAALELYFMTCGLFGKGGKPPIRIMHCFPQLELAYAYTKTKLNTMIATSISMPAIPGAKKLANGKLKSFLESKFDNSSAANDNLQFKQFDGGNHIWIESTGIDANRLRGRTVDVMLFDECFVGSTYIEAQNDKITIKDLFELHNSNKKLPLIKTYNKISEKFEYKNIIKAWNRGIKQTIQFKTSNNITIKCTDNHKFLTDNGWKEVKNFVIGELIKSIYGYEKVINIEILNEQEEVYDLEVEDNHNFIVSSNKLRNGLVAHNCQDMRAAALGNAVKILSQAQYGRPGDGIQVFFGTPKQRGSEYWKIWNASSQQYFYLGCENCSKHFPLYTPGSNEWEKIWIEDFLPAEHPSHGFIVKCTHCNYEQDKRQAAERGKWVAHNTSDDIKFVGYHINQLYMPNFNRAKIIGEKPENHPINTERAYQNEVLGEFFAGDASPITPEQIEQFCGDEGRKFSPRILLTDNKKVYLGCDWGDKVDADQLAVGGEGSSRGQSYSCVVVLVADGPHILSIEYCWRLKRNDLESKKGIIEQLFRQYSVNLAVGDVGYANDLTEILQREYGEKFLGSRASAAVKNHTKFTNDIFPKEIVFERDYYIAELYSLMKEGKIRFPYGDYEKIGWLVQHCASMEIKPTVDRTGEVGMRYVKGSTPNDGFMALLNAYLAYKFDITNGFEIYHPNLMKKDPAKKEQVLAITGYMPRGGSFRRP